MRRSRLLLLAILLAFGCRRHPSGDMPNVNAGSANSLAVSTPSAATVVTAASSGVTASSSPLGAPSSGAPTKASDHVEPVEAPRDTPVPHQDLHECDDVTSGFTSRHCLTQRERLAVDARLGRKKRVSARLAGVELDALERAAQSFFDARESSEVDRSGALRGDVRFEERTRLEEAFVAALERVHDTAFPEKGGDLRATEADHESVYLRVVTCQRIAGTETIPGAVTLNGIRNTERLWLSYRDAWIALGTRARAGSSPDVWRTWVTQERTAMLRKLATGC